VVRRIDNGERSLCEIGVHAAHRLPAAVRPKDEAAAPTRIDDPCEAADPSLHESDRNDCAQSGDVRPSKGATTLRPKQAQSFDDA
jgi:hypothetical protein